MYTALLLLLLGIAAFLFITGAQKRQTVKIYSGLAVAVLTSFFFWFMGFWGEALWYENLGYGNRYWTVFNSNAGFALAGALLGFISIYLLTLAIPKEHKVIRGLTKILGIFIGAIWGVSNWDIILKFWNGVSTGLLDPILGKDVGFYLFSLPFYDSLYMLFFSISLIALISSFIISFLRFVGNNIAFYFPREGEVKTDKYYFPLYLNSAVFVFILAWGKFIDRYHIMYSTTGVVAGPGWTDVNVLLPAYMVVIILMVLIGFALIIPAFRKKVQSFYFRKFRIAPDRSHILVLVSSGISILAYLVYCIYCCPRYF